MRYRRKFTVPGLTVTVREVNISRNEDFGYLNFGYVEATGKASCRITIDKSLPEVLKPIVLLHEILHIVDDSLHLLKITRRPIPHKWIIGGAPRLAILLAASGAFHGLSKKQVAAGLRQLNKMAKDV